MNSLKRSKYRPTNKKFIFFAKNTIIYEWLDVEISNMLYKLSGDIDWK